jgi:putative peptide zinc metalloprotease protein
MLLCSLNTLLINGNPLLRYDGYYLLSDFCRVPNLAEAGNEEAVSLFRRLVTGEPPMFLSERSEVARICIGLYGVFAAVYRLTITAGLLALVYRFVEPSGLGWVAIAPGIAALSLHTFRRIQGLLTHLRATQSGHRVGLKLAVATGLLITLLFVPVSIPMRAPFVLIPGNAVPVFVRSAGQVEWLIRAGSRVNEGDVLARLKNGDLELKISEAEGEIALRTAAAAGIRLRQLESGSGDSSLAAAEELLESARRRLDLLKLAQSELTIRSPRGGIVFPARSVPQLFVRDPNRQSIFQSADVLDATRSAFWLQPQTQLCTVGEYVDLRALVCVRQSDIALLSAHADAGLRFDSSPSDVLTGLLEPVSGTALQTVPPELVVAQRIPTDATGAPETGNVWYPLTVRPMNIGSSTAPLYATGTAFLETAPASIWSRLRRLAGLTFSLPF